MTSQDAYVGHVPGQASQVGHPGGAYRQADPPPSTKGDCMFGKSKKSEGAEVIPQRETPSRFSRRVHGRAEAKCDECKMTEPFNTWTRAQEIQREHNAKYHR